MMAQLNPVIGDVIGNTDKVLEAIELGKKRGVDCVLFAEMTLCGYAPHDLLLHENFIDEIENQLDRVVRASKGIAVIVGLVRRNSTYEEKNLLNTAAIIDDGKLLGFYDKWLLPTYDVFNERRYFARGKNVKIWNIAGKRVGVVICEDMWQNAGSEISGTSYPWDPIKELVPYKPDVLFNLTASPFQSAKADVRVEVCRAATKTLSCPVLYACQVGASGNVICDGYSLFVDEDGAVCKVAKGFEEDFVVIDLEKKEPVIPFKPDAMEDTHMALILGVKDYFVKSYNSKAIIGITGGLDSALVAAIAVKALGKDNVIGVHLPSKFITEEQTKDARDLAKNLGIKLHEIAVKDLYKDYEKAMNPFFDIEQDSAIYENLVMRIRASILMAFANKEKGLLLCTANKTELALGYCALYGDMAGALTVIGDVLKTNCYKLAQYINKKQEIIPSNILNKPSSEELRHHKDDKKSLPSYQIVDRIIKDYVEDYKCPEEIAKIENIDFEIVSEVIRRIYKSEHKRRQAAPSLRVSKKSFAVGRKKPLHYRGSTQEKIY
ncbi:MAG: Glutamine-dependent NAD(+) synthetase [Chlamydiia bacterium]|nr:Glutamine-dependent NAD(+) synthetase [Chlamydiia bacterium]